MTSSQRLPDVAVQIGKRIEASVRPLITSHIRLDGDAIGAALALAHILKRRDARPHVVNDGRIPQVYRFLPGIEDIGVSAAALRDDYDLAVALDIPTWSRAGAVAEKIPPALPVVSIDHHPPMERVGDPEWVDTGMSSAGEMLYRLSCGRGWEVTPAAATCLYVAILTDTGRFTFPNTTPSSLRAAADLIELGADHVLIAEKLYQQTSPALMSLRAGVTEKLKLFSDGRIAVMTMTRDMLQRAGVNPIDTQEITELPRSIAGVVVGVLLKEMADGAGAKISLRARDGINIEPVARHFGGGGHAQAAGCEIAGDLDHVERVMVRALTEHLNLNSGNATQEQ